MEPQAFEPGTRGCGFVVPRPKRRPAKWAAVAVGPDEVVTAAAVDLLGQSLDAHADGYRSLVMVTARRRPALLVCAEGHQQRLYYVL